VTRLDALRVLLASPEALSLWTRIARWIAREVEE
jgi:hypothetical protein